MPIKSTTRKKPTAAKKAPAKKTTARKPAAKKASAARKPAGSGLKRTVARGGKRSAA